MLSCSKEINHNQKKMRSSYTLQKEISRRGIGVFTGEEAILTLKPLPINSGIVFQRTDLLGSPQFKLNLTLVQGTPRCTIIGNEQFSVQTVEHLMAALHVYGIDDLLVQLSGPEIPIFDGSALPFVEMIEESGLFHQGEKEILVLKSPVYWSRGDVHLVAFPAEECRISYTLHYPNSSCIGTQFFSFSLNPNSFKQEIAPCRTFSIYEEIAPLIEKGFLKGGSLESALVIKDNLVLNPGGLRLPEEMVRHKILDMIGDLYLMGFSFFAHIIAIRSGHHANNAFANELLDQFKKENF
ncbi:MAG: UDP-3-O-acyl-N-acetylglucosamine deacetylase [Chlamydiota bacterium]